MMHNAFNSSERSLYMLTKDAFIWEKKNTVKTVILWDIIAI